MQRLQGGEAEEAELSKLRVDWASGGRHWWGGGYPLLFRIGYCGGDGGKEGGRMATTKRRVGGGRAGGGVRKMRAEIDFHSLSN